METVILKAENLDVGMQVLYGTIDKLKIATITSVHPKTGEVTLRDNSSEEKYRVDKELETGNRTTFQILDVDGTLADKYKKPTTPKVKTKKKIKLV